VSRTTSLAAGSSIMSKPAVPLFNKDKENISHQKLNMGKDGFIIDKEQHPVLA
jgi:hypothetical protein